MLFLPTLGAGITAGAILGIGGPLIAKSIREGGDIIGGANPPSFKRLQEANEQLDIMKAAAKTMRLLESQAY